MPNDGLSSATIMGSAIGSGTPVVVAPDDCPLIGPQVVLSALGSPKVAQPDLLVRKTNDHWDISTGGPVPTSGVRKVSFSGSCFIT